MLNPYKILLHFLFLFSLGSQLFAQKITTTKSVVILSAIKGSPSKADTIKLSSTENIKIGTLKISGDQAGFFKIISPALKQVNEGKPEIIILTFEPPETFIGIAKATLEIKSQNISVKLTGLSTKGLEGENEAPLSDVVDALGYKIDIGWKTLANNWRPDLQGEELAPALFKRAKEGKVEMVPVARYSPDFNLNFGYYSPSKNGPVQHQVGILAKAGKFPEHQTLFPSVSLGQTSFDPGEGPFGFYAISPGHSIYSEDMWNILFYPPHATHAMRIYPVHNEQGVTLENTYLVSMEEAVNGDYNDYVFIVRNIKPVFIQQDFSMLMNGKNLDGWHTWFQGLGKNNDPNHIFTVEADGVLHDTGKDLGYIITEKAFNNYHFILEFKWGEKRWPPREANKRDSGICYNIPEDDPDMIWPASIECQIQEGDVGDLWLLNYSTIQVDGKQNPPLNHSQIVKKKDGEKPTGEWNTVEVISFNGKCAHIVNGVVVNYGDNASLLGGRILLQSEYAEIYYRNVKIREF